jgi:hypothetical protein
MVSIKFNYPLPPERVTGTQWLRIGAGLKCQERNITFGYQKQAICFILWFVT